MKIFLLVGLLLLVVLCDGRKIKNKKERKKEPMKNIAKAELPSQAELLLAALSNANNEFAFDLYKILRNYSTEENVFFSPGSLSTALSMTLLGTRGKTSRELGNALNWQPKQFPHFHAAMRGFLSGVQKMNDDAKNKFEIANSIWLQQDFPVREEFMNKTSFFYFAPAQLIDFQESEEATEKINNWVKDKTRGKITDIIPDGALDSTTKFVLTNALFFKGSWEIEFDKKLTVKRKFYLSGKTLSGKKGKKATKMVSMMRTRGNFGFSSCEDMAMVELPYKGGNFSMIVIRPDGDIEELEEKMDLKTYQSCFNKRSSNLREIKDVIVSLPKFKVRGSYKMREVMQKLGVESLFDAHKSNFNGMVDPPRGENLFVDEIFHQAFVKVNEIGAEAASSTAVVIKERSMNGPINFYIDRPFLFTIQEKETGAIFFVGKVSNP